MAIPHVVSIKGRGNRRVVHLSGDLQGSCLFLLLGAMKTNYFLYAWLLQKYANIQKEQLVILNP